MIQKKNSWAIYSEIRVRPPFVIRADGRGFGKVLRDRNKPYDIEFARSIVDAAVSVFDDSGLAPLLAYIFSDEINLLFVDAPFNGRVEKLDSVVAGFLSGSLSVSLGKVVSFDSRVIPISAEETLEYLTFRQDEAWRNHVFSYGFYALISDGKSPERAMEILRGKKESEIHEMLFSRGTNLAKTPAWQRRGVLVYRAATETCQNWDLPLFKSGVGRALIEEIVGRRIP